MSAWVPAIMGAMAAYDLFVERPKQRKEAEKARKEEQKFLREQERRANIDRAYQTAASPYTDRGPQQSFSTRPYSQNVPYQSFIQPAMQYGFAGLNLWQQMEQQKQQEQLNKVMMDYYSQGKQPPTGMRNMKKSAPRSPYLDME